MKPSEYWNDNRTEREFEECGLQCCTRTNDLGHRCGYVALPKGHPLFGKDWDKCYDIAPDLEVDGGITFANGTDDMWILGWDAAHAWHRQDWSIASDTFRKRAEECPELYMDFYRPAYSYIVDADMAERETRHFAQQLAKLRGEGGEATSATDELRRMLDERGVEYEAYRDIKNRCITKWRTYHGAFVFFAVEKEGELFVETLSDTEHSAICTPDQAIAATLGGECEIETYHRCKHCGFLFEVMNVCPNCGRR